MGTKTKANNECGAVAIVEAAFVFPIMFIVLIFLIYFGNAYFVKAQVDAVVSNAAIKGAAYCADPLLADIKSNGNKLPSLSSYNSDPYRYILGGMNEVEKMINNEVYSTISGKSVSGFSTMKPKIITKKEAISKYNNYVVYSTFAVEVKYQMTFPLKMIDGSTIPILTMSSRAETAVDDTAEFIRNTDMVIDLLTGTKFMNKVKEVFGKVNDFINKFSK